MSILKDVPNVESEMDDTAKMLLTRFIWRLQPFKDNEGLTCSKGAIINSVQRVKVDRTGWELPTAAVMIPMANDRRTSNELGGVPVNSKDPASSLRRYRDDSILGKIKGPHQVYRVKLDWFGGIILTAFKYGGEWFLDMAKVTWRNVERGRIVSPKGLHTIVYDWDGESLIPKK